MCNTSLLLSILACLIWKYAGGISTELLNDNSSTSYSKFLRDRLLLYSLRNKENDHLNSKSDHLGNSSRSLAASSHVHTRHSKSWSSLAAVDGLRNDEVAVFVTSTAFREGYYLRARIISATRTWMKTFANVFVIIEDTFAVRYSMRHCAISDFIYYTSFDCPNDEPTFILSRNCTNEYYGANGPCCKVDDGINYLVNDRPKLFEHIKFILHCDDDEYWRADQTLKWLAAVQNSGINHFPIIANGDPYTTRPLNPGLWGWDNCLEVRTGGWYQPMMINHAALAKMRHAVRQYGLKATCNGFTVTHDVGVGPFVWQLGLNHIFIPGIQGGFSGVKTFTPVRLAVHYLKPFDDEDYCHEEKKWPASHRYNQTIALGCGSVDRRGPFHNTTKHPDHADNYDMFEYFRDHGQDIVVAQEGENHWVRAKVTLENVPESLQTDAKTGLTTVISPQHRLKVKDILSTPTFSKDPALAKLENPSKIALSAEEAAAVEAGDRFRGDKIYQILIPDIVNLYGYESTEHAKKFGANANAAAPFVAFTAKDCSPPGKRQNG